MLDFITYWLLTTQDHSRLTYQVRGITPDGEELPGWRVSSDDGVDLAAHADAPDTLAVTDVHAPVHTDGQPLGKR